ncbi:MAG: tail-specific protease [Chlorobi bacterium]|nr:tail-specific protease [Chlorobiota bacterium]
MKRNLKFFILLLGFAAGFFSFRLYEKYRQQQLRRDQTILGTMRYALDNIHYQPAELDDDFSEKLFYEYIKRLDPSKRYFLQSDIDSLAKYKYDLDNQIREMRFDFFEEAYSRLMERQKEAEAMFKRLIKQPIDLNEPDSIVFAYDSIDFPRTEAEKEKRWLRYLKYSILTDISQEKASDKKDSKTRTAAEYQQHGVEITEKNYSNFFENLFDLNRDDYIAMYFNTIANLYDPHTAYFKPADKERFDMDMSGSFEGIGARLQKEGAYTKIVELIPGGPAWKDGKLEVGDIILKVRQEDQDEPVDVVGMRIDEIVKLIRGKKGTTVYLTVKKLNGTITEIPIVRDKVVLEETFAKSLLIEDGNRKIGYIYLPKFYHNFNDKEDRNSAGDIKKELLKLERNGAQGVILDLRDNGGGSLGDVIDIAGYFIDRGPVVQVRGRSGRVEVRRDYDTSFRYDKPVVVLVNEMSASASEILAGALQDYKRALIIGGNQTYGKGTVQRMVDLAMLAHSPYEDLGSLKLTLQKFYRITGESTQKRGVIPDVRLPDRYKYLEFGEKDIETALPYDTIPPARYRTWDRYANLEETAAYLRAKTDTMRIFRYLDSLARYYQQNSERHVYPLRASDFTRLMEESRARAELLDSLTRYRNRLAFRILPQDSINHALDTVFFEKRKRWIENLQTDPYLEQAVDALERLKLKEE